MADHTYSEKYRIHNMRGSDGPCECIDCQDERWFAKKPTPIDTDPVGRPAVNQGDEQWPESGE